MAAIGILSGVDRHLLSSPSEESFGLMSCLGLGSRDKQCRAGLSSTH